VAKIGFSNPYGAPEHRKALGVRPEGIARKARDTFKACCCPGYNKTRCTRSAV
jgi:hypothetical protein